MTEVKLLKGRGLTGEGEEKEWLVLDVEGHAQYAPKGQDIVCAAESMLVQALGAMLAGMEERELEEFTVSGRPGSGGVTILAMPGPGSEQRVRGAFECVGAGFGLLARQYPRHVKLDLQIFAEGGASGEAAPAPAEDSAPPVELSRAELRQAKAAGTYKEENPLAAVRYGVQEEPEAAPEAEQPAEQPAARPQEPAPDAQRQRIQSIQADWARQEAEVRRMHPEFSLAAEKNDPAFASLVLRGVPLRQAYEATHFQELLGRAMAHTARTVEQGMAARIESRGLRAAENGTRPGGAAVTKTDVNSLTRADREEIERRVLHGEKIRF